MKNEELLGHVLTELKQLNNNFKELFDYVKSVQKTHSKENSKNQIAAANRRRN